MKGVKLTQRGRAVLLTALFATSFVLGIATGGYNIDYTHGIHVVRVEAGR